MVLTRRGKDLYVGRARVCLLQGVEPAFYKVAGRHLVHHTSICISITALPNSPQALLGLQAQMPPKKKEEPKERPILGRFKSHLKVPPSADQVVKAFLGSDEYNVLQIGIVGLPNVGKSTLFNVLTKMGIPAENFPFCTIEPNHVRADLLSFQIILAELSAVMKKRVPSNAEGKMSPLLRRTTFESSR